MKSQAKEADANEDVTDLLRKWNEGADEAFAQLIPLIYTELRQQARQLLRNERPNQTMQTAALVNEAYLRLIDCNQLQWKDRHHFFAIAARVMRRVLVGEARKRNARKRGAGAGAIEFDEAMVVTRKRDKELIALDDALRRFEKLFERKSRVVELRYFIGLTIEETASVLGVSADTVKREWRAAKMWLRRELNGKETSHGSADKSANQSDVGSGTVETD